MCDVSALQFLNGHQFKERNRSQTNRIANLAKHIFCVFIIRLAEWAVRITFMLKPIQIVFKASLSRQQLR